MADLVQYYGTGRRKSSVARVFLRPGNGEFTVNSHPYDRYFVTEEQRNNARQPLLATDSTASFNVVANVSDPRRGEVAGINSEQLRLRRMQTIRRLIG